MLLNKDSKLTVPQLKDMAPDTVFKSGIGYYPKMFADSEIKWVATRGGIHDWAIYFHMWDKTDAYVQKMGDKLRDENMIKQLVKCDDESFDMYRY